MHKVILKSIDVFLWDEMLKDAIMGGSIVFRFPLRIARVWKGDAKKKETKKNNTKGIHTHKKESRERGRNLWNAKTK